MRNFEILCSNGGKYEGTFARDVTTCSFQILTRASEEPTSLGWTTVKADVDTHIMYRLHYYTFQKTVTTKLFVIYSLVPCR
jgi:hypothetical protein